MKTESIKRVGIIGAGRMGSSIGQEIACAGFLTNFYDVSPQQRDAVISQIQQNLRKMVNWLGLPKYRIPEIMARITVSSQLADAVTDVDLVIEAIVENLELKQAIFVELEALCLEHCIFASNTSTLMPRQLADKLTRPERLMVAHYFYPAYLMPLVELVCSSHTSQQTLALMEEFLLATGKKPIRCQKEVPGFIANRLQIALEREAFHMVERGIASAQDVDKAVKYSFGRRMGVAGPFEILEHNEGYDMTIECEKYLLPDMDTSDEPYPLIRQMVENGDIGLRAGRGFYEWDEGFTNKWRRKMEENLIGYLKKDILDD